MPVITLPDGSQRQFDKPVTVLEEDLEGIIGREEVGVTIIPFLKHLSIYANLSALRLD